MNGYQLPLPVIAGCLIWIPISIAVVSLIGWMIQGDVDVLVGFLGISIAVGMGVLSFVSKSETLPIFLLFGSISLIVLVPIARKQRETRELAALEIDQLARAYENLAKEPGNVAAKLRIAKLLWNKGVHGSAIALADGVLQFVPKDVFAEELAMVKRWKAIAPPVPPTPISCVSCGTENAPGELYCQKCGDQILLHYARGHWVHPELFHKLVLAWMAAMLSIVGIPLAGMYLSPNKSPVAVVLLLAVSGYLIFLIFRKKEPETA